MSVRKIDLEALAPTIQRLWFASGLAVEHQETTQAFFGQQHTDQDGAATHVRDTEPHSVALYRTKSLCWFAVIPFGELLYATPPYLSRDDLIQDMARKGWTLFQRMIPDSVSLEYSAPKTTEKHRP